ncbi:MAG TPA: L,D-transpeptidase family protein [Gaiellaceae bacterium]|nr:L,D-transpeptidase family protein [Gaiellaceae bacterium]
MIRSTALIVLVLGSAFAVAPAAGKQLPVIPRGVEVGGVQVGGLITVQAEAKVQRTYDKPLHLFHDDSQWTVKPGRFGAEASIAEAVEAALDAEPNARLDLEVVVRKKAVRKYVDELDERFGIEPRDAQLVGLTEKLTPKISAAEPGRRVAREKMIRRLTKALQASYRGIQIEVLTVPVQPEVTEDDLGHTVVIRRGSNRLTLWKGATLVRNFTVATGSAEYPTPTGTFEIVNMQRDPTWTPPDSDWAKDAEPIPPGPGNPLGTRWMGISSPAVGIHGTPDAASLGYSVSHGCIRMAIPEAEWLFEQVDVGTQVYIVSV